MPVLTTSPLSELRMAVASAVTVVPVWSWPPDDVAAIPCVVVGPPTLNRDPSISGLWTVELPVLVIGRRYDMAEVHAELDDLAWTVAQELDVAGLWATSMDPGTATVGGHEQPTYTLTITTNAINC